jgi:transposase
MKRTGSHPWRDHRRALNGLFWTLRSGAPWRAIAERSGPWRSIDDRDCRWCREEQFTVMLVVLRTELNARD